MLTSLRKDILRFLASLREQQAAREHRYGRLWLRVLSDAQHAGAIDSTLDPRAVRDILLGAMNSTLNATRGFDPDDNPIVDTLLRLLLE